VLFQKLWLVHEYEYQYSRNLRAMVGSRKDGTSMKTNQADHNKFVYPPFLLEFV